MSDPRDGAPVPRPALVGTVGRLTVFPVKSAAGIDVTEVEATPRGLLHDRRFALVDPVTDEVLTQRDRPGLARLRPSISGDDLFLCAPGVEPVTVPLRPDGEPRTVDLLGDPVRAVHVRGYRSWLRAALDVDAELYHQPDPLSRPVTAADAEHESSLSDAFPYLVANAASGHDLEQRMGRALPMDRFRANIVVDGAPAWAEDGWRRLACGQLELTFTGPCVRCTVTTVDQTTGERTGGEPLTTLARFRRGPDGRVRFAVNAVATTPGPVRVGDPVRRLA